MAAQGAAEGVRVVIPDSTQNNRTYGTSLKWLAIEWWAMDGYNFSTIAQKLSTFGRKCSRTTVMRWCKRWLEHDTVESEFSEAQRAAGKLADVEQGDFGGQGSLTIAELSLINTLASGSRVLVNVCK